MALSLAIVSSLVPAVSYRFPRAAISTIDPLASAAALGILQRGGSSSDAAIAANAVLSVVAPDQCGLGGDLFALVLAPPSARGPAQVYAIDSVGRAGSKVNAEELRAGGNTTIPRGSMAGVTVPGCVDGWLLLSRRFGLLRLDELLADAARYARDGFVASDRLIRHVFESAQLPALQPLVAAIGNPASPNRIINRPGTARVLDAISKLGRDGFYAGEFGAELMLMGAGQFTAEDLAQPLAAISNPIAVEAFGYNVYANGAPSAGYLALGALAWLSRDGKCPQFASSGWYAQQIQAFKATRWLREYHYDGSLVGELLANRAPSGELRTAEPGGTSPDTTAIVVSDHFGSTTVIVQSNGHAFGSRLATPDSNIFLHDRGAVGFNLREGDPNELRPGARPRHTLSPLIATDGTGKLRLVAGTMGGDKQPSILTQLVTGVLRDGEEPSSVLSAARFSFSIPPRGDQAGFDTFDYGEPGISIESNLPKETLVELEAGIGELSRVSPFTPAAGVSHLIVATDDQLATAVDPRSEGGSVIGF